MAYRKYVVTFNKGGESPVKVQVQAKKTLVQDFARKGGRLWNMGQWCRELGGVIGERETSHLTMSMFGGNRGEIADPEAFEQDRAAWLESLPETIKGNAELAKYASSAVDIFERHVPTVDNRETPSQRAQSIAARQIAYEEREKELAAKSADFRAIFSNGEKVTVPTGMMAVTIKPHYDNSDTMTDYFDRRASYPHSSPLILGLVRKGQQREATARRVLSAYPELEAIGWTWKDQNYSMGGGYFLESEYTGERIEGHKTYGGQTDPGYYYIIKIDKWSEGKELYCWRDYPGEKKQTPTETSTDGVTVDHDRDWTWITFPAKPSEEVRAALKSAGGRWSRKRGAWYIRRPVPTAEIMELIGAKETETGEKAGPAS